MKKILLFVSLIAQSAFSQKALQSINQSKLTQLGQSVNYKAAGDIIWEDDFSVSSNWTIGSNGQGSFVIGTNTHPEMNDPDIGLGLYMGNMSATGTTAGNGFAFFNGVQHLINLAVDPQDSWVQSDTIDLSGYPLNFITLSFNQRYRHLNYDSTYFEISEDGGQTWVSYTLNEGIVTNDPAVQNTILKLIPTNQSAQTILRFRWISNSDSNDFGSGYGWMIDDVKLIEPYSEEISILKVYTNDVVMAYDYYSTPLTQVSAMKYGAILENLGANSIDKYIKYEVKLNSNVVYLDSTLCSLSPGLKDTIWVVDGYTPDAIGTYEVRVYLEDLGIQTNNSLADEFKITEFIYGHNYPTTGSQTFGFTGANALVGMGNVYACFQNQQLNGIQVQYGTGTKATTEVEVEFKEVVAGSIQDPDNLYLGGSFYTITSPINTSTPTNIPFDEPIQLEAGKVYMVVLKFTQSSTQDLKVKSSSKGNDDFSTIGYGPFGQGDAVNYYVGWPSSPHISLNFDPSLSVNLNELNENRTAFTISPNPTSGETTIAYSLNDGTKATIEVVDLAGKTLISFEEAFSSAGNKLTSFDASSLASGVYTVKIKSDNSTSSQKFIKK
jgi:hypothetical protein